MAFICNTIIQSNITTTTAAAAANNNNNNHHHHHHHHHAYTAVSHLATCLFQWLLRRWVLWQMRHNFFWQRLAGEQRFVQPIRGKPRFVPADFCGNSTV